MDRKVIFGCLLFAALLVSVFFINTGISSTLLDQKNGWSFNTSTRDTSPIALPISSGTGFSLTAGQILSVSWNSAPTTISTSAMRFYLLNSYQIGGWRWVHDLFGNQYEATDRGYLTRLDNWATTINCTISSTDTYYVIFVAEGQYNPIVGYGVGVQVYSYASYLFSPPTVTVTPSNVTIDRGQSQLFTSTVSGGTPPYAYQWYLNQIAVSGATSSTWAYTFDSAGISVVNVNVNDSAGFSVYSGFARVYVNIPPSVSISPSSVTMDVGQSQIFNSTVSYGTSPYSYQWYRNGAQINGATSSSWTFTPSSPGSYIAIYVLITDNVGVQATSDTATVTVNSNLSVSILPSSTIMNIGQSQPFTSAVSGGTSPYAYQWYLNGTLVSGATSSTWTFTPTSAGSYTVYVNVTDAVSVVAKSNTATVTVNAQAYTVTFDQVGVSSDFAGTVLTVDSASYSLSQLPFSFSWTNGSLHSFAFQSPLVVGANSKQYVWTSTTDLSSLQSGSITVSNNGSIIGNYKTQYFLTVASPYGSPSPSSGWFDSGSSITESVTSPVSDGSGVQYVCTGWSGSGSVPASGSGSSVTFTINAASAIAWGWKTQYYFTVTSPYGSPSPVSGWFDSGSSITESVTSPVSGGSGIQYTCTGWMGTGSLPSSGSSQSLTFMIGAPSSIVWNWNTQYQITFNQTGVGPDYSGTVVTVDSANYGLSSLPVSLWFDNGSSHIFWFASPLIVNASMQYNWASTSGLTAMQSGNLTITASGSVNGNYIGQALYNVTIGAHCNTEGVDVNVPITMDGSSSGHSTAYTFTGLTGNHTFTVPSADANGDPFLQWSTGQTSTTITVTSGGTYTAYYQAPIQHNLTVSSAHDSPIPGIGDHTYSDGYSVTCNITSPVIDGGVSYTCTGWSGTGSVPSSGSSSSVTFNITQDSTITWIWQQTGTLVHDVALTNITSYKTVVGQGYGGNMSVIVENNGNYTETVPVTVYANSTIVESQNVTLSEGNSITIFFTWNTTGFAYGNYTLSAYALPVLGETNTADNNCTCNVPVHVGVPGDVSSATTGVPDGIVNMRDIAYMVSLFNTKPSSPNWNPNADVNNDGVVNMKDIAIAILNFNHHE